MMKKIFRSCFAFICLLSISIFVGCSGCSGCNCSGETETKEETTKITFESVGGELDEEFRYVDVGEKIGELPVPEKRGYTFNGWKANGKIIDKTYVVEDGGTLTLVADYTIVSYTITYDLNDGSVQDNPTEYNVESDTITLKNPTKEGYSFLGWTGTGIQQPTLTVTIEKGTIGDLNYVANWKAENAYTVLYVFECEVDGVNVICNEISNLSYEVEYGETLIVETPTVQSQFAEDYYCYGWRAFDENGQESYFKSGITVFDETTFPMGSTIILKVVCGTVYVG